VAIDLERMRDIARGAALVGGEVVRATRPPELAVARKGLPGDWVTSVDVSSENEIRSFLHEATPDVAMVGEEEGGAGEAVLRWVVDPLDGTTNFVHGFWAVGVSVALVAADQPVAGAVHAPFLGDTWHAARGAGAVWEQASGLAGPCRVSDRAAAQAIVATGFPFRRKGRLGRYLPTMAAAFQRFEDLRRVGAACLDLAWTACGVFDGFFELGLGAWDVAAGGLLVLEAGGVVTDWDGNDDFLGGNILAAPPGVHEELLEIALSTG
jgi:myo-inositol-1(or 4)-monophosphatase